MNDAGSISIATAIDRLSRSAAAIVALVQGIDAERARWKPAPERWSMLEIVRHLADEEREDFRARLGLTLDSPEAEWPPIDPERAVVARAYNEGDLHAAIEDFSRERGASLQWLASLRDPDLATEHRHPIIGPLRAGDLLLSWVAHDLLHLRQLARLQYDRLIADGSPYRAEYAGAAPTTP